MSKRKGTYTPAPSVPREMETRYAAVLAVLSKEMTLSEAAERLGLSRVQMQTLVHRAQASMLEGLASRPPGRAPKSAREQELETKLAAVERENAQMRSRGETAERLMGVMGDILKGRTGMRRRTPKAKDTGSDEPEEPDRLRADARRMMDIGLTGRQASKVLGISTATLARHLSCPSRTPISRQRPRSATSEARAAHLVRATHGLIGAEAVSHATGLSRRAAAEVKGRTVTAMERERQRGCERITVTQAGVVRGFDQLWAPTRTGMGLVLVSADGAVPYRTSLAVKDRYDGRSVAEVLDSDFRRHGAPLVCRLDRASCHRTSEVDEILDAHQVLRLHGPPRHPQYYAQLERQNREHQAWLAGAERLTLDDLGSSCEDMLHALNELWPRRSLGWMTAAAKWAERVAPCDDRRALRQEVADCAARLRRDEGADAPHDDLHLQRLAIEHVLETRGYLQRQHGGWC